MVGRNRKAIFELRSKIGGAIFDILRQTDIISSKDLEDWGNSCIFARETINNDDYGS